MVMASYYDKKPIYAITNAAEVEMEEEVAFGEETSAKVGQVRDKHLDQSLGSSKGNVTTLTIKSVAGLKVAELKEELKKKGVSGYSNKKKPELVQLLKEAIKKCAINW